MAIRTVIDGVPLRLRGVRKKAAAFVEFIHECCDCGLQHDVTIKHHGRDPDVDITFNRIRGEKKT